MSVYRMFAVGKGYFGVKWKGLNRCCLKVKGYDCEVHKQLPNQNGMIILMLIPVFATPCSNSGTDAIFFFSRCCASCWMVLISKKLSLHEYIVPCKITKLSINILFQIE